jgi:hypothetical protein
MGKCCCPQGVRMEKGYRVQGVMCWIMLSLMPMVWSFKRLLDHMSSL